jgi:hypothetical protein
MCIKIAEPPAEVDLAGFSKKVEFQLLEESSAPEKQSRSATKPLTQIVNQR